MNGRKTPAVAYITRLIKTTSKTELNRILQDSPLKTQDINLILSYANGASYEDLAEEYHISKPAIYARKRKIYETLHFYLVQRIANENEMK